jgi:hypothetical protein
MNVTKDQAQGYLDTIRKVQQQTRRTLAHSGIPFYMIIWGAVWLIGFLGSYFLPSEASGYLWFGIDVIGMVLSFVIGWWHASRVRRSAHDTRIGFFWLIWLVYTGLIVWLSGSIKDPLQIGVVVSLMAMFGYTVMGLWLWTPLVWIGAGITALITVIYLTVPQYTNLIMAILGGGTLMFSGLYIYRNWR